MEMSSINRGIEISMISALPVVYLCFLHSALLQVHSDTNVDEWLEVGIIHWMGKSGEASSIRGMMMTLVWTYFVWCNYWIPKWQYLATVGLHKSESEVRRLKITNTQVVVEVTREDNIILGELAAWEIQGPWIYAPHPLWTDLDAHTECMGLGWSVPWIAEHGAQMTWEAVSKDEILRDPDVCVCMCFFSQSCPTLCNPMDCSLPGSSVHGDSPGKNIEVGCHALLQGIFPTQGLNPGLLHCRWILYSLSYQGRDSDNPS